LQIYRQKQEAHERELQQPQDAASARQHEDNRVHHSRFPAADDTPSSDLQHVPSESWLPSRYRDVWQMTVNEQEPQAALSQVDRRVMQDKLVQQTLPSSLPLINPIVIHQIKEPQSFPDRLASIQKQREMEEAKTFARSSVRALKVSEYMNLNRYVCDFSFSALMLLFG